MTMKASGQYLHSEHEYILRVVTDECTLGICIDTEDIMDSSWYVVYDVDSPNKNDNYGWLFKRPYMNFLE